MSLRTKLITSVAATSLILALLTLAIFAFITYLHIDRRVKEVYSTVSRTYAYILKTISQNTKDVVFELKDCKLKRANTYLVLRSDGLYVGRVRDCVFYGTNLKGVLDFMAGINGIDWTIVYDREVLERIKEPDFFDGFVKDRVVLNSYIVEGRYDPTILSQIQGITGYKFTDRYTTLLMDFPLLIEDSVVVGRVIFIKDFAPTLREALLTPILFLGHTLLLVLVLSSTIFFSFSRVVKDIYTLRDAVYKFKELDFSELGKLSEDLRRDRRRDELFYLKRAVLNMAQELESSISQLKMERDKLEELAYKDALTGLHNRRFFMEEMKHILETTKRYREPLSVMMLDVDNFKRINDEYGHDVGDLILKQLADVIVRCVRSSDIAARLGGEEFVVALPKTNLDSALTVADRIRQEFKKSKVKLNGEEVGTTVSVGIASFEEGYDLERLLKEADEALYEAKRTGKDKVVIRKGERQEQG